MRPSDWITVAALIVGGATFGFFAYIDHLFPWWVDLIGAAFVTGSLIQAWTSHEADRHIIDDR